VLGAEAVKANQPLGTTQFGPVLAFVIGWQHYFLLKDIKPDDTGADCLPWVAEHAQAAVLRAVLVRPQVQVATAHRRSI
jgi:hypothetical protein